VIVFLDAHALLWWWSDDAQLVQAARRSITDSTNTVVVSAGTVWEIAVKRAAGRLAAPIDLLEALRTEGFDVVPVTGEDAVVAAELPGHHRDPFDRLLIAQAQRLDALVVTRDRAIAAYEIHVLPT
jgi:PIN domain nuclease of toxin-antitoxin system